MENGMVNVAVVGTGGIGRTHIDNIGEISFATITDICDLNPAAEPIEQEIAPILYTDLTEMLEKSTADVVLICTPTFLHYSQIAAVLRSGKHCISEKPLCLSATQARELYALAKEHKVFLYVAHVLRFWEEYEFLAEIVKSKRYGDVKDAYFYRLTQRPEWISGGWLFDCDKSGLLPYDLHIHELDYMVSLFGKPKSYSVQSGKGNGCRTYRDYYRMSYNFSNGLTACAEASWYDVPIPFRHGYRVYFQQALIEYDGKDVVLYEKDATPCKLKIGSEAPKATQINVGPTTAFRREMMHFLTCVSNCEPSGLVKEDEIVAVLEILESIEK